jgi:UDP-2,3-diacylglucosamine hydrolase
MPRTLTYFVSDVHLGLEVADASARESRFVDFLRSIPKERTEALYLLGDIWDFWYEYRDVVPKGSVRVFAALTDLIDAGVKVFFFPGNHDIWAYGYFEELGLKRLDQPYVTEIGGKRFCLGHGDGLGPVPAGYKFLRWGFHNRFLQRCFSTLHPWIAFRLGKAWSRRSRLAKREKYVFKGKEEPLYRFCQNFGERVDFFIFGHYHCVVDLPVGEARLLVLGDWMEGQDALVYDASSTFLYRSGIFTSGGSSQNTER